MLNIPEKGDGADDDASSLQGDTKKETVDSWQRRTHNVLFKLRLAYDPTIAEFLIRDQSRFSHFFPLKQSSNAFQYLYLTPVLCSKYYVFSLLVQGIFSVLYGRQNIKPVTSKYFYAF